MVNPVRGLMWVKIKLFFFLSRLVLMCVGLPHCCTNVCASKRMEVSGLGTARLLLESFPLLLLKALLPHCPQEK